MSPSKARPNDSVGFIWYVGICSPPPALKGCRFDRSDVGLYLEGKAEVDHNFGSEQLKHDLHY